MATDGRISSMIRDLEPDESNIFETSKPSGGSTSGYITRAVSLNGIANAVLNEMEYTTDLETEAKQVIPAINEIYTKGGKDSVLFVPQELTEAQKVQARQNIGASGGSDVTMQDNTKGGVDLTVGGVTRTLVNKSDVTFTENKSGGLDLSVYNTSATLARQTDLDDLRAEVENKTLRFVDQQEEGMNYPPEGAIIESLLTVDGKSEQKTYKGYNLGIFELTSGSVSGFVFENLGNDTFSMVGTRTATNSRRLIRANGLTAGTYQVRTEVLSGTESINNALQFALYNITGGESIQLDTSLNRNTDFTIPEGVTDIRINAKGRSDQATIDAVFRVWLVKSENASEPYEPYTGGIPSPSPDYPHDMGGYVEEINFKLSSKNLCPDKYELNTYYGTQGKITSNGYASSYPIKVEEGKVYSAGVFDTVNGKRVNNLVFATFANETDQTALRQVTDETITIQSGENYVRIRNYNARPTWEAERYKMQLEIGSPSSKYEPYRKPETKTITPPFPLKKIRGTSDYCNVTQGEWVRYFDLRRLSAEENWTSHAISGSDTKRYKYTVLDLKQFQTDLPDIMSNYFTAITSLEAQTGDYLGIYIGNYAVEVCVTQQTVEEFKQWLEETEVYLLAPLIKPVVEPIETEDLFYLKSLQNLPAENILTITDQNGEDCSYLMKYLVQRGATTP